MKVLFLIQILVTPLGTNRKETMSRLLITSLSLILFSLASAHSNFQSSVPENGAVLETAPSEVIINFEGDIQPAFSIFKVYILPADMLADSEGDDPSNEASHEHGEQEEGEHGESDSHGHEEANSPYDTAAKMFIPTVIDMQGDEEARADAGLATTETLTKTVTVNLKENLAPGVYVAMFRVLSADTHTVEGFITFEIHAHE